MKPGKTILIVDDEIGVVEVLKARLQRLGYNVFSALNGEDGLRKIQYLEPDLIVLDINMPKMGGIEFFKLICDKKGLPRYRVIITTARKDLKEMFTKFNIDGFMAKPFPLDDLVNNIQEILF